MNSIISWVGGKRILRKKILPLIPKHDIYCEVFGGAAWILFGKSANKEDWQLSKKSRYTEVYNDINGDLVNFWKYIKNHPEAFVIELNNYLIAREMFDNFMKHEPEQSWRERSSSITTSPAAMAHAPKTSVSIRATNTCLSVIWTR